MKDGKAQVLPEIAEPTRVLFKPHSWLTKIEFIKRLIVENNVLIALMGEQGGGKTTFANILHLELGSKIRSFVVTAGPLFEETVFLKQLAVLFNVDGTPSISKIVAKSNELQSHVLLIIDDAHYLSATFIEEILKEIQQQGSKAYFHSCLASNFSLKTTLNGLAQHRFKDMIHSVELGPLTESETKAYLVQRLLPLKGAEKVITDERLKLFYQLTEGHLVDINRQMVKFFSNNTPKASPNNRLFRGVGIAASVALAVIGAAYILQSKDVPTVEMHVAIQAPETQINLPLEEKELVLSSEIPAYVVAAMQQHILATPLRRSELALMDEEDAAAAQNESMPIIDKVVVAPKTVQQQPAKPQSNPIGKSTSIVAKKSSKGIKKAAIIKPIVEQSRYTIQLLASHNKGELERFVQVHHMHGKIRLHRILRQGTVWYVLTLGEYAQRQQAKAAVNHLPKDIVQFKPWVRSTADLKGAG